MASGRPVLALEKGGATETVIKGKCGDFFEKPEVSEITRALKKFDFNTYDSKSLRKRALEFEIQRFKEEFRGLIDLEYNKKRRGEKWS